MNDKPDVRRALATRLAKTYIPAAKRARSMVDFLAGYAAALQHQLGAYHQEDTISTIMTAAAEDLGRDTAYRMQQELALSNGRTAAVNAWLIAGRLLGFKMKHTRRPEEDVFEHVVDPLWSAFRAQGKLLCRETCLPMTRALARALAPDARVDFVSDPTLDHPCIKRIRWSPREVATGRQEVLS